MVYFRRILLKAYFITAWTLLTIIPIKTETTTRNPTEKAVISNFLKEFVRPYVKSLKTFDASVFRAGTDSAIESMIKDKVKQLAPYLQDDILPANDDQLTLEGEQETTIIEFIPQVKNNQPTEVKEKTKTFKDNIRKFKKLREKIKKALLKEHVTDKTKSLVTTTLDDMIAQMIGHKCNWRGENTIGRSVPFNKTSQSDKSQTSIANSWNRMWDNLKNEYLKSEPNSQRKVSPFFNKFQDLISAMTNDFQQVTDRYKIVCHYADMYDEIPNRAGARRMQKDANFQEIAEQAVIQNKLDDGVHCGSNFKVCTEELVDFLIDFYNNLNETAVTTVRNYAAMFLRDVNDDGHYEKERIVGLIHKSAEETQIKVAKAFKKHTSKLKLDDNKNQHSNIKYISNYIAKTIEHSKKYIHASILKNLDSINEKLMKNIIKDLDVNLDVDLGNLERDINSKICPTFEICNGKLANTRRSGIVGNKHNIYVQVQLDLEHDNKVNAVMRSRDDNSTGKNNNSTYKNYRIVLTRAPTKVNVTRTVPRSAAVLLEIGTDSVNVKRKMRPRKKKLTYLEKMQAKLKHSEIHVERTKPMPIDKSFESSEKSSVEKVKTTTEMTTTEKPSTKKTKDFFDTSKDDETKTEKDSSKDSSESDFNSIKVKSIDNAKNKTEKHKTSKTDSSKENSDSDLNNTKAKSTNITKTKAKKHKKLTTTSQKDSSKSSENDFNNTKVTTDFTKTKTKKHKKVTKTFKKAVSKKKMHSKTIESTTPNDNHETIRITKAIERKYLSPIGKPWYKK